MSQQWVNEVLDAMRVPGMPRVFVLGSFERRVTIYSQQVRALNLVDALARMRTLQKGTRVAVVGAGSAGLTFAAGAARRGAKVTVLERENTLLPLFRHDLTRWLHPRVYDWPLPGWQHARAGLPVLDWTAARVPEVRSAQFEGWAQVLREVSAPPRVILRARDIGLHDETSDHEVTVTWNVSSGDSEAGPEPFQLVVFAVGFGHESASIPHYRGYWEPDDLDDLGGFREGVDKPKTWLVSGCGDGALTDLLRLCLRDFRHDRMVADFAEAPGVAELASKIVAIEGDPRAKAPNSERFLSESYRELRCDAVIERMKERARPDTRVSLNATSPHYFQANASALNRFLLAQAHHARRFDFVLGKVTKTEQVAGGRFLVHFDRAASKEYDRVLLRHGPRPHALEEHPLLWTACDAMRKHWREAPSLLDQTRRRLWDDGAFGPELRVDEPASNNHTSSAPGAAPSIGAPAVAVPPLRPKVLLAGPWFGVPREVQAQMFERLKEEPAMTPERREVLAWELRSMLDIDPVQRAQMSAIVTYDVIIDASPWRAFGRWNSIGFRAADAPDEKLAEADAWWLPACPVAVDDTSWKPLRAALERPTVTARLREFLAEGGLAVAGFGAADPIPAELLRLLDGLRASGAISGIVIGPSTDAAAGLTKPGTNERWVIGEPRRLQREDAALDLAMSEATLTQYLRALRVVAGQVQLTGQLERRPIEDVFVTLECHRTGENSASRKDRRDARQHDAKTVDEELAVEYELRDEDDRWRGRTDLAHRIDAASILAAHRRVFLEGAAGTGKTTLLKWIGARLARNALTEGTPVWVRLSSLGSDGLLAAQCARVALALVYLPTHGEAEQALANRLERGEATLLLDGLDEANPMLRAGLEQKLRGLPEGTRVLLSSRPTARLDGHSLPEVRLRGLAGSGAERFVIGYFDAERWCADLLRGLRRLPDGDRWARTPQLLAMASDFYRKSKRVPEDTIDLYEAVVKDLFDTAARQLSVPPLEAAQVFEKLAAFARGLLWPDADRARADASRDELRSALDHRDGWETLALRTGLFTVDERVRFSHLTLGEFLAATGLGEHVSAPNTLERATAHEGAPQGEVFSMAAARSAEALLALMARATEDNARHGAFRGLLRALAYGGEDSRAFAREHGLWLIDAVYARIDASSGRFSEDEIALSEAAERAFLAVRAVLPTDAFSAFEVLLHRVGRVGDEAMLLAGALGAPRRKRRLGDGAPVARVVDLWIRQGVRAEDLRGRLADQFMEYPEDGAIVRALAGREFSESLLRRCMDDHDPLVRQAALQALANDPLARDVIRARLDDTDLNIREVAVQALANDLLSRSAIRTKLYDREPSVREVAVQVLANDLQARDAIRKLLDDPQPAVRAAAVQALANASQERDAILARLDDTEWNVRVAVVWALANDVLVRDAIRGLLNDLNPNVREATVLALANDPQERDTILAMLNDPDEDVRQAAAQALANDSRARPHFYAWLRNPTEGLRQTAVRVLADDPRARDVIRELRYDPDRNVRVEVVQALANDSLASDIVRELLDDPDDGVRAAAVMALANNPQERDAVRAKLDDPEWRVREAAALALADDPLAQPTYLRWLNDPEWNVRLVAVQMLAGDPRARDAIFARLADSNESVREVAVQALANDPLARSAIRGLLDDNQSDVREAVVLALANDPQERHALRARFDDPNEDVRQAAVLAFANDALARQTFNYWLQDPSGRVRATAVQALSDDPHARDAIRRLLNDPDWEVRDAVVHALVNDPLATHTVRQWLDDPEWDVRLAAVHALAYDPRARDIIRESLNDPSEYVRAFAVMALANDPQARDAIRKLLDGPTWRTRQAAVVALANDPQSRDAIRAKLNDPDNDVRQAAIQALTNDPQSRETIRTKLNDSGRNVRLAAVHALADTPSVTHLRDPDHHVRIAIHRQLSRRRRVFVRTLPIDRARVLPMFAALVSRSVGTPDPTLDERAVTWFDDPRTLSLDHAWPLAQLALVRVLERLAWASFDGTLREGRALGHLTTRHASEHHPAQLIVHVEMLDLDLPANRDMKPLHNLLEAWRAGRHLLTAVPLELWLVCADVDLDLIELPKLSPGEVHHGPVVFGFRLHEGLPPETRALPPALASNRLDALGADLPRDELLAALYDLAARDDLHPWAIVPVVAQVGGTLPAALRARLGERLPTHAGEALALLDTARRAVGAPPVRATLLTVLLTLLEAVARDDAADLETVTAAMALLVAMRPALAKAPDDLLLVVADRVDLLFDRHRTDAVARTVRAFVEGFDATGRTPALTRRLGALRNGAVLFLNARRS